MRHAPWIWLAVVLLSASQWSASQNCTTYAVVGAFDRKTGDDVTNLDAKDFEARLGHTPLSVVSAMPNFNNRIMVLLQIDGTKNDKIEDVVNLASRLSREAPEGRPLAFGAFAQRSVFTKGFSTEPKERALEISAIIEDASTLGKRIALYDALHNALARFAHHQPGDTILLVTDGFDDVSRRGGVAVEREFAAQDTRLVVMLRQTPSHVMGNFMWKNPELDPALLQRLAARTGGAYMMFSANSFGWAWEGYMLGVNVPQGNTHSRKWKLRLQENVRASRKRPNLVYPERLPPCSPRLDAQAR